MNSICVIFKKIRRCRSRKPVPLNESNGHFYHSYCVTFQYKISPLETLTVELKIVFCVQKYKVANRYGHWLRLSLMVQVSEAWLTSGFRYSHFQSIAIAKPEVTTAKESEEIVSVAEEFRFSLQNITLPIFASQQCRHWVLAENTINLSAKWKSRCGSVIGEKVHLQPSRSPSGASNRWKSKRREKINKRSAAATHNFPFKSNRFNIK